jgi:hypothetical protein
MNFIAFAIGAAECAPLPDAGSIDWRVAQTRRRLAWKAALERGWR